MAEEKTFAVPETAKVAVLVEPGKFELKSYPIPEIGDDEMLIKVEGCGVCGTDGHEYKRDPFGLIPVALIVGFILGAGAMIGVAKIIQLMGRLAESGNIVAKKYLGETGTVYIPIPADGKGTGKVNIALGERYVEFEAITEDGVELKSGESVRVTDIRSETLLVVEKV